MNQLLSYAPPRPASSRTPWMLISLVIALAPAIVFLAGIPLQDTTCQKPDCWASPRRQWIWDGVRWAVAGAMLGAFVAGAARIGPWVGVRPGVRKGASIAALCALVPVTCFFAYVIVVIWNNECTGNEWFCFSGPKEAVTLGSPGIVSGVVCLLLAVGLARPDTRLGRALSTAVVTGLAASVVAVSAGIFANALMGHVVDTLSL